jgi:hypothetical protein
MKFKEIRLYPSVFTLDVYVVDDASKLTDLFEERYGADEDFILTLHTNLCLSFDTDVNSELKGNRVFVIIFDEIRPNIVSHELIHLMWQLSEVIGIELNTHSQEWQALFMEYLTSEILKDDYEEKG